ncbi:MAG TPA: hypothetical protein VD931_15850 [Baekduia sp.]|nr:hypothetical protein [Baekduia sp.]
MHAPVAVTIRPVFVAHLPVDGGPEWLDPQLNRLAHEHEPWRFR